MNDTNVLLPVQSNPPQLLDLLTSQLDTLTPEVRKAATFVLENPNEIGVSSIRQIDAFCIDRHIELVPNQNSFGHFHRLSNLKS